MTIVECFHVFDVPRRCCMTPYERFYELYCIHIFNWPLWSSDALLA
jgi:hypothetical protein